MADLLLKNTAVILLDRLLENHSVFCEDGKIVRVCPADEMQDETAGKIIDASGCYLAPGFIDLHCHGLHRCNINNGCENG